MPRSIKQKTTSGAPLGNQNARKHGGRSAEAIEARRRRSALMKAAALLLSRQGWSTHRCKCKPLRPDQIRFVPPEWLDVVAPFHAVMMKID
jgi:hypothetical protein